MAILNGKRYHSSIAAYQVLVRPERKVWNRDGDVLIDTVPPLTAEFAYHGGEFAFDNTLTGARDVGADIRGFFFDSALQAEEKGWSQEEHDLVVSTLDKLCDRTPEYIWHHEAARIEAPWPTYDQTHHNTVPQLAEQLGLVDHALQYEQQNLNRPSIVAKLTETLNFQQAQIAAAEELTAA